MAKTNKKKSKNNLVLISTIFGVIILIMGFFIYNGYRKYLLSKDIVCISYNENGEEGLKYIYVYNDEGNLDYLIEKRLNIDSPEMHNFYEMYTEEVERNPKKFKGVYATLSDLDNSRYKVQYIFDLNNMNSDDLKEFYGISVKELQSKSKNFIKNELYISYGSPIICK